MIHPQKRIDVALVIKSLLVKLVQLRHVLAKWHPLNPDLRERKSQKPFTWDCIDFDDLLTLRELQPENLEVPVPLLFRDSRSGDLRRRDLLVSEYMRLKLGVERVMVELDDGVDAEAGTISFTMEEAILVLQRNERGRQGKMRSAVWRERRAEEARAAAAAAASGAGAGGPGARGRRAFAGGGGGGDGFDSDAGGSGEESEEMTPDDAAMEIQRLVRGHLARRTVSRARAAELVFIGMKDASRPRLAALEATLAETARLRRIDQVANREGYEAALEGISRMVGEEEGPGMRDTLRGARLDWFASRVATGELPEGMAAYYAPLLAAGAGEVAAADGGAGKDGKGGGKGGKDAKAGGGKDAKGGGKGGKDSKGKGKAGAGEEEAPEVPPPVSGPSEWGTSVEALVRAYAYTWSARDEKDNVAQRHDAELARQIVRPRVEESIKVAVDEEMEANIKNFKAAVGAVEKKAKKAKKAKKPKGKKVKQPPGHKYCEGMDPDQMLTLLVENRMINNPRATATFATFIGGINLTGSAYSRTKTPAQVHPITKRWIPADPSMAQVRECLIHYGVLTLPDPAIRAEVDRYCAAHKLCGGRVPRSLLLYGPHGVGKTHLAQAVANATGALFINLSAGNVDGKFLEKGGAAKLLHMAWRVAKSDDMMPAVIYMDEVERMMPAGKKSKGAGGEAGPGRFKKDLLVYAKWLTVEDSVLLIGSSSEPWEGDLKAMRDCFDKHIYVPCPDYATRIKLWRHTIAVALAGVPDTAATSTITTSALTTAFPTDGGAGRATGGGLTTALSAMKAGGGGAAGAGASWGLDATMDPFAALPLRPVATAVTGDSVHSIVETLNLSGLASVSNGYTAGGIRRAVKATLTARRLERIPHRPLLESEFLTALARCPKVYADVNDQFRQFCDDVTGLSERLAVADDEGDGKDKKAAKGKKK